MKKLLLLVTLLCLRLTPARADITITGSDFPEFNWQFTCLFITICSNDTTDIQTLAITPETVFTETDSVTFITTTTDGYWISAWCYQGDYAGNSEPTDSVFDAGVNWSPVEGWGTPTNPLVIGWYAHDAEFGVDVSELETINP